MSESISWARMNIQGSWSKQAWHVVGRGNYSLCNTAEFTAARIQKSKELPPAGRICITCKRMLREREEPQ